MRKYWLFTPSKRPASIPLVFVFHGNTANSSAVMWESKFNEVAEKYGFAVVYPDGLPISNRYMDRNRLCWNDGRPYKDGTPYNAKDLDFIRTVFDDVKLQLKLDLGRVFSAGYSNGGHFALRLSQEYSWVRAAASLAGQRGPNDWMIAKWPKSVLLINGTQDGFAPFNGGLVPMQTIFDNNARPVIDSLSNWNKYNKVDQQLTTKVVGNANILEFVASATKLRTKLIAITGMGHVWPGGNVESPYLGPEDNSVLGSEEMWKFFQEVSNV